jgi:hypothetical protein|eukprot:2223788-Prymnesium_polylepis.2
MTRTRRDADESSTAGVAGRVIFEHQGAPLTATIGAGQLIEALDAGLVALCPMNRATVVAPSACAQSPRSRTRPPTHAIRAGRRGSRRSPPPHTPLALASLVRAVAYGQQGAGGAIPPGATLRIEIEVAAVRLPNSQRAAPDVFREIDVDGSGALDEQEVEAHFARLGKPLPPALWRSEDKDRDRRISWREFGGPKAARLSRPNSS